MRLLGSAPEAARLLQERVAGRLCVDSRQVRPGDAFIAWPGHATDGRRYVRAALEAGASLCLVEAEGAEAFGFDDERILALSGLKAATGWIANAWFGAPSERLDVVASTGTNGKTSTAWWVAQALSHLGRRCGVVGTLGVGEPPVFGRDHDSAGQVQPTGLTTPDPVALQSALARFIADGLQACAIEASSIGIAEHRLAGTRIAVALFTNFTRDHLDYHGSMEAYWRPSASCSTGPACAPHRSTSTTLPASAWRPNCRRVACRCGAVRWPARHGCAPKACATWRVAWPSRSSKAKPAPRCAAR